MNKLEYKPLTLPKLSWDKKTLSASYGQLTAAPLEPGFGMTLGNALRRMLLGAIEGSAVTSIIVQGVNNEFAAVPGVVEDVMQLVLNIKQIVIKNTTNQPGTMKLSISGKDIVTVADIKADEHLELVNTDLVLAHLSEGAKLEIEFFVESGRGYQAAAWPLGKSLQDDNRIYLDAMFCPVIRVMYDVEKTRVGKDIDYDKLVLHVHTNGAENPVDVLNYAVSVLRTQLETFLMDSEIPFNELSQVQEVDTVVQDEEVEDGELKGLPVDLLLKSIDELELSARAHNCLVNAQINRVIDLVNFSEDEGLKIKNFGRKSLDEVKESLRSHGLRFGMNIDEEMVAKSLKNKAKK
ncbi:DNA-directed RNA polymerase subunit alpha [bacterium]|nr:DNA-directed RNA polymerase subunit alpha [bacterium]NBX77899.1 DNA-directed RNA polymerase subunit alpha [bacterium]